MFPSTPRSNSWPVLGAFLLAYVLAWTVLPAVLSPGLPLDVVEGIAWGREWQWGYYKHPPMPAWLLYPAFRVLGRLGPYLVSQLAILLALAYVYRLARELLDRRRALLAAALPYAVYYYTWPTLEFNHNIAQIPVWAALAWHAQCAARRGRPTDWLWLGAWAGLGVLTKYSSGVLLACLGVFFLLRSQRAAWRGAGPWLAILAASMVAAPHLVWLLNNDALPLAYLAQRSHGAAMATSAVVTVLAFLGAQILAHLPLLLILTLCGLPPWHWRWRQITQRDRAWLFTIGLAPALVTVVVALAGGIGLHDMWGTPMWNFSGVLLLAGLPASQVLERERSVLRGVQAWMLLVTLASALYLTFGQSWRGRPARMDWPRQAIADAARHEWQRLSSCPLRVVAGDTWLAGQVASGMVPMPSVLIAGDPRFSPWVPAREVERSGFLAVGSRPDEAAGLLAANIPRDIEAQRDGQVHAGRWVFAWPRAPDQAPRQLAWRAWVPAGCAR